MSINLGIVMDAIESISVKKDTSLSMLLAAQKRGWAIQYMEQTDLYLAQNEARARMRVLSVKDDPADWYSFGKESDQPLAKLDVILMRKDPPFDMNYIYATYLLEQAQRDGCLVVNDPRSLRDCNEKLFAAQFPQCCPPMLVSASAETLKAFHLQHKDTVYKPLDGMGGTGVFRVQAGDPNLGVVIETLTCGGKVPIMAQRFVPEITAGDKRILLIDGKPVDYALARIPPDGETRGNLAVGAKGVAQELTEKDRWICEQVSPALRDRDLLFVGVDVIGDYLTEINVTSPTCMREIEQAYNIDIAGELLDCIAAKLERAA
ncbi:MAG: glutathione synthase [Pseudohongiellaceae bacterium]